MSKVQVTRLHSLTGHRDPIYTLQPSDKPSIFFSAAGDGMVVQWDLEQPGTGQLVAKLPNSVYALRHLRALDLLVAGHNYDGIHVLDYKNKKEVGSLQFTQAPIFDMQELNGQVIAASGDGALHLIDIGQMEVQNRVQASAQNARTIAINTVNGDVAVGFSDHSIRVFDAGLALKKEWKAHAGSVFTLRFTPDQRFLVSGSRDARLKLWDATHDYQQAAEVMAHLYAINHLDFSPDGKHFVTCSMDKSIKVWDTGELQLLKVIDKARHAGHGTSVNKLLWTSHHGQLVSASDDRTLSVWQIIF